MVRAGRGCEAEGPGRARLQLEWTGDRFGSWERFAARSERPAGPGGGDLRQRLQGESPAQEGARFLPAGLSNEETEFVVAAEQGLSAAAAALRSGAGRGARLLLAPAALPDPQAHRARGEGGRGALAALDHGPPRRQPRSGRQPGRRPAG